MYICLPYIGNLKIVSVPSNSNDMTMGQAVGGPWVLTRRKYVKTRLKNASWCIKKYNTQKLSKVKKDYDTNLRKLPVSTPLLVSPVDVECI
jgi:hypothetical protein